MLDRIKSVFAFARLAEGEPPETIEAAALQFGELVLSVPRPGRHHSIFKVIDDLGLTISKLPKIARQGFVTSHGRFVSRSLALAIAERAGQVAVKNGNPKELYSEDVW